VIEGRVGSDPVGVASFYLTKDPLDLNVVPTLLRSLLYVSPVRWSLRYIDRPGGQDEYRRTQETTSLLVAQRGEIGDKQYNDIPLWDFEMKVVMQENLMTFYHHLVNAAKLHKSWLLPENGELSHGSSSVGGAPQTETLPVTFPASMSSMTEEQQERQVHRKSFMLFRPNDIDFSFSPL